MEPTIPGAVCFVANDFNYIVRNGGVGTYFWLMARLLARAGWRVHVLSCSGVDDPTAPERVRRELTQLGIHFTFLQEIDVPTHCRVPAHTGGYVDASDKIRHALEVLHARHRFDLIEFADWHGAGFCSVQAKRAGLAFGDAALLVKLHGPSQWSREEGHAWLTDADELRLDYVERYAFEHADFQLSPSRYMLAHARILHWNVRADAAVSYPYPDREFPAAILATESPTELVFFGRLEIRKGLDLFLDALDGVDSRHPIAFLGKDTTIGARLASEWIAERLSGRSFQIHTDWNREQALRYLAAGNRLAVIPSRAETFGFVVAECAVNSIPFVAARTSGIPEVFSDARAQERWLFPLTAQGLRQCLQANMDLADPENAELRQIVARETDPNVRNRDVVQTYAELLAKHRSSRTAKVDATPGRPLVSVGVAHFDLGEFLPEALEALERQTYDNLQVVIVDDGSTEEASRAAFNAQEKLHPRFRFLRQANAGPGQARNRCLAEARGDYFVSVDADNIPLPGMIEAFVRGMERQADAAALTCYVLAFADSDSLRRQEFLYRYMPTGGPHVTAAFENIYGDNNAIFRADALRSVGGFETDRATPWEDWETFVKLVNAGHRVDVVPEPLVYYRCRQQGRLLELTKGWSDTYPFARRLLKSFFGARARLSDAEQDALWTALLSFKHAGDQSQRQLASVRQSQQDLLREREELRRELAEDRERLRAREADIATLMEYQANLVRHYGELRFRLVDQLNENAKLLRPVHALTKRALLAGWDVLRRATRRAS